MSTSETSFEENTRTLLFEIRALFLYTPLCLCKIVSFSTGRTFLFASKDMSFKSIFKNWHSGEVSKGMTITLINDFYFENSYSSRKSASTVT